MMLCWCRYSHVCCGVWTYKLAEEVCVYHWLTTVMSWLHLASGLPLW